LSLSLAWGLTWKEQKLCRIVIDEYWDFLRYNIFDFCSRYPLTLKTKLDHLGLYFWTITFWT
jgi:hypothetical protein